MTVEDCESVSRMWRRCSMSRTRSGCLCTGGQLARLDRPLTRIEDYERFNGELAKITLR
jgi:hypothetical protein